MYEILQEIYADFFITENNISKFFKYENLYISLQSTNFMVKKYDFTSS
jgi:hypothetical protein